MSEIYTDYTRGEFKRLDGEIADLKAKLEAKDATIRLLLEKMTDKT